jgi:hypothetical protein
MKVLKFVKSSRFESFYIVKKIVTTFLKVISRISFIKLISNFQNMYINILKITQCNFFSFLIIILKSC